MKETESFQLPSVASPSKNIDLKYQKAIKEISKLINLNTNLKNQNNLMRTQLERVQTDYKYLEAKYLQALEDLQQSSIVQLKNSGLVTYRNSNSMAVFIEKVRKSEGLDQILNAKNLQIDNLKQTINELQQTNRQLIKNCLQEKNQIEILSFKQDEGLDNDQERKSLKMQLQICRSRLRKANIELNYYKQHFRNIGVEAKRAQCQCEAVEKMGNLEHEIQQLKIRSIQDKLKSEEIAKKFRADNQIHLIKLKEIIESVDQQRIFINKYFPSSKYI